MLLKANVITTLEGYGIGRYSTIEIVYIVPWSPAKRLLYQE